MLALMIEDPKIIPIAVKRTYVAKYMERIADHATNIAEMVIYMCKGKIIRHMEIPKVE
jgi:phosphate transport system protein